MAIIKDEVLNEINGGRGDKTELASEFPVNRPMFAELAKEAGLADLAKVDALYNLFQGVYAGKLANIANDRALALKTVREFLNSPAALALANGLASGSVKIG